MSEPVPVLRETVQVLQIPIGNSGPMPAYHREWYIEPPPGSCFLVPEQQQEWDTEGAVGVRKIYGYELHCLSNQPRLVVVPDVIIGGKVRRGKP